MHITPHPENRRRRIWATVPALLVPFAASVCYSILLDGTAAGQASYVLAKVFLIAWPVVATLGILRERIRMRDKSKPRGALKPSLVLATLFSVATVGLMFALMETPLGHLVAHGGGHIRSFVERLGVMEHFVLFAIFLSLVHSFQEEFFWRWFIFGNLRQLVAPWKAIAISSIGFVLHHVVILSQFFKTETGEPNLALAIGLGCCVGLWGAVWCWLYHRFGTLWGAWLSHILIDLGIMWLGWNLMQGA